MADLKTTNIYGDAYINNKVGIATNAPATRLQIGQLSPTAATEGIQFGDDTNTRIYRGASGQINFNGTINVLGNTYLGDGNGDTTFINDIVRIGATDSGDASLFFGEGGLAGSDYGLQWYWDSGYTFYWYTRNAGTNTQLFNYVTNDLSYVNWNRNFNMQNYAINYNAQIHFNAGTRFVGNNTSYLLFRSDSTGAGGIQIQDGSTTTKGYTGYWDTNGGGILNNSGEWAVRYNFGSANSGGTLYGAWTVNGNISATNLSGTNTGDQTIGNGTITIAAGTGIGVGTSNTFTMNQSGATTVTVTNNGVTSNVAGTGISVSGATGAVTITNSGVTSAVAGTGISVSGATGAVTFSIGQAVATNSNPTFGTLQLTRLNFGATGATPYSSAAGEGTGNGITFGGDEAGPGYRIFTGMENYGGNYSKLTINWHTGIRIGAYPNYGGVRFYNNAVGASNPAPSEIFSVGKGDSHVRVENYLIVGGYLNVGASNSENPTIGQIWTQNTADTYLRKSTPAHFRSQVTDGYYLQLNPDGDGVCVTYSDQNPTFNGVYVGGGWYFGADGSTTSGGLTAKILNAYGGGVNSTNGYYVGNNDFLANSNTTTTTLCIDSSNNHFASGVTMTNLTGAYQNTTVYDSAKTQSATPSRGIRAPASSIQFTDSYAIAPFYTYRSTGDWPVPYGIGWGTGGESSGIFQRYASNGSSFGDMIFYTGNDGSGAFSFRRHTWEGTAHFAAGSGELSTELFRVDWAGNVSIIGGFTISHPGSGYAQFSNWVKLGTSGFFSDTNSAHIYPNNASYGSWRMDGTRNGWGGIEFGNNGVSLMMGSDTVGFHQNTNGWLFRVHNGSGFIYKGSWGGGTAATILDSSNQAYAWAMNQNVTTTSSPTFSELTLSGTGIGAYGFVKYGGIRNGNWQTFTDSAGEMNIIQTNNITDGNHSNYPTGVYGYGAVLSWRTSNHSFQLYAAHTGDLAYKTQWDNDNYSGWRRILDSTNYVHAANMNQYVRTTDNPTFGTVTAALSGNATTATTLQTARNINGTSFNGSAAITTATWGTARTLTIGSTGKSVDGSAAITWSLAEIGAAATNQTMFIGTTSVAINRSSAGQTLTGVSIDGSAASATSATSATNAGCITSDTGNVGDSRLQYWQTSGNTTLNPDGEWYNAIRMGHGNPVTYYGNTLAVKMTGTNLGDIYTRTLTNGTQGSWNRFWNNNNDGAGSGLDADLVDGLDVHTGRNDNANKVVRTDSNGYIQAGWINTTSGDNGTTAIDRVYASQDGYIRYYTPANFRTVLDVPTRGGSGASGNWAINITGNAATATLATKASTLSQGGGNGTGMTFNWSGQSGQPTWLWGSNDGTNIYVWNPSNFNVNSATTATTANALNTGNSYTITGLTSNGTISIFPSYVSPYSSFLRMGYDNSGNYEYTIKRDGTTGFLEFYNTQANYTGYYFRVNGSGGGLGIAVSPASRLHVNGDGTNPAVRVDNTGVVLAASVGSNGRQFYGWLPISVDGTTRWIRIFS